MVRLLSTLLMLFSISTTLGQSGKISGRVTSAADNSPIPGVSITVKGTQNGTMSSSDGTFSLQANRNSILVFSSVGYLGREITVGDQTVINLTLQEDNTALSEVVVTALGISRESKTLTYSTQQLSGADL